MKKRSIVFCCRCEGKFSPPDQGATLKTECPYCGFGNVVTIETAGYGGTQRTADSDGDATAATSITVT